MKNKRYTLYICSAVAVVLLLCFIVFVASAPSKEASQDDYNEAFASNYHLYSPPIPSEVSFAGEIVPIARYDVREALDRELLVNVYWQSNLLLYCKRAYRWFPVIEPILKANGVPEDFKYLALIESGFMNVTSPAKASGFWQFIKETGINHGLEINDEVDERYHLEKATEAACKYLKNSYKQYNSWALAAAAYNMGDGGVKKNVEKQQVASYWDLRLNEETARYVYRILAAKIILSNPQQYGIRLRLVDLYQPIAPETKLQVDSSINNLADFAIQQGITYKQLKDFNPWLRGDKLTNKGKKTYNVLIPSTKQLLYEEQIKNINPNNLFE
ncbi:MAG: lytic transglycosylase domain-containing protein [Lentimicrobiaceae bacterium]|nr:lytic transglycosylase domain-containing protein [Lentimicrobiaceae bacterium]